MCNIKYCKSETFREGFILVNNVTRHICHIKNSRLGHNLPTLVKGQEWFRHFTRVLFSRNLASANFPENKILVKISEFTVKVLASGFIKSDLLLNKG